MLRFDAQEISDELQGAGVESATLELFVEFNNQSWGPGRTVDIHRLQEHWTEDEATWNCAIDSDTTNGSPDCSPLWLGGTFAATPTDTVTYTDTTGNPPDGDWVTFDVTADVDFFLANPTEDFGWIIKKTEEHQMGRVEYTSMEGTVGLHRA